MYGAPSDSQVDVSGGEILPVVQIAWFKAEDAGVGGLTVRLKVTGIG